MELSELERALTAGKIPPVLVVLGSEAFLRRQVLQKVRDAVLGGGGAGFNEDVFVGKGLRAAAVASAVRTMPMFGEQRLVLVREVDAVAPAELDLLLPLLTAPTPGTCLVLVADKLDGRAKLVKAAKKAGVLLEVREQKGNQLRRFVRDQAHRRGKELSEEAALAVVEAVGSDLSCLDDAVERLSLFCGADSQISVEAVERCVARVRADSVWALVDAVGDRQLKKALLAAGSLLKDREPPLRILALLARQMRLLARMKEAVSVGLSASEAAKRAGVPPFKARDFAASARKFDPAHLAFAFRALAEADLELKGARRDGGLVLEETLLRLCTGPTVTNGDRYSALITQRRKLFRASA